MGSRGVGEMGETKTNKRTTQGLRDALFDELDELRGPEPNPEKSMAVANIAKQIINTAKVELDFHRMIAQQAENGTPVTLGNLQLGSPE